MVKKSTAVKFGLIVLVMLGGTKLYQTIQDGYITKQEIKNFKERADSLRNQQRKDAIANELRLDSTEFMEYYSALLRFSRHDTNVINSLKQICEKDSIAIKLQKEYIDAILGKKSDSIKQDILEKMGNRVYNVVGKEKGNLIIDSIIKSIHEQHVSKLKKTDEVNKSRIKSKLPKQPIVKKINIHKL